MLKQTEMLEGINRASYQVQARFDFAASITNVMGRYTNFIHSDDTCLIRYQFLIDMIHMKIKFLDSLTLWSIRKYIIAIEMMSSCFIW